MHRVPLATRVERVVVTACASVVALAIAGCTLGFAVGREVTLAIVGLLVTAFLGWDALTAARWTLVAFRFWIERRDRGLLFVRGARCYALRWAEVGGFARGQLGVFAGIRDRDGRVYTLDLAVAGVGELLRDVAVAAMHPRSREIADAVRAGVPFASGGVVATPDGVAWQELRVVNHEVVRPAGLLPWRELDRVSVEWPALVLHPRDARDPIRVGIQACDEADLLVVVIAEVHAARRGCRPRRAGRAARRLNVARGARRARGGAGRIREWKANARAQGLVSDPGMRERRAVGSDRNKPGWKITPSALERAGVRRRADALRRGAARRSGRLPGAPPPPGSASTGHALRPPQGIGLPDRAGPRNLPFPRRRVMRAAMLAHRAATLLAAAVLAAGCAAARVGGTTAARAPVARSSTRVVAPSSRACDLSATGPAGDGDPTAYARALDACALAPRERAALYLALYRAVAAEDVADADAAASPPPGGCYPLGPAPGCPRALRGCVAHEASYGSGGGTTRTLLVVHASEARARAASADLDGMSGEAGEPRLVPLRTEEEAFCGYARVHAEMDARERAMASPVAQREVRRCLAARGCRAPRARAACAAAEAACWSEVGERLDASVAGARPWSAVMAAYHEALAEAESRVQCGVSTLEACRVVYANACTGRVGYVCRGLYDPQSAREGPRAADELYAYETVLGAAAEPPAPLPR